jgi:uncharacterized protein (DUF58 family)
VRPKLRALGFDGSRRGLARLNHIFIPEKKPDRDRVRKSWLGRISTPVFAAYASLSRDGRALVLIALLVGLVGLDVRLSQVHLLFAMLAGLLAASFVARFFFRAPALRVLVEAPARVSVGDAQRFLVHLDNPGPRRLLGLRVFAPFLPWDGTWTSPPTGVAALEPGARTTVFSEATFDARGEHHLDPFEVAPLVPFGLALGPRRESDGVRFLVVPRIADVAPLRLVHRRPRRAAGAVVAQAAGESEIAGVRPYRTGDPLRHLHARTWARTGTPHVRQYVTERSSGVALLVWVDGARATERAREAALEVAAGTAAFLALRGAGLDLLVVDDRALRVEPRSGRSALDLVLDRLAVHRLSEGEALLDAALEAHESGLSTLVLVTADEEPRRHALVSSLARRGFPVQWISVEEDDRRGAAPARERGSPPDGAAITRISVARVEQGHGAASAAAGGASR